MDYKWASPDRYELLKEFAKENRLHMTDAENFLWLHLMNHLKEAKFKRQFIIGDYIADFASIKHRLVIEVDGAYHSEPIQIENDEIRTSWLNKMGWKVVRFSNEEVFCDIQSVLHIIENNIELK